MMTEGQASIYRKALLKTDTSGAIDSQTGKGPQTADVGRLTQLLTLDVGMLIHFMTLVPVSSFPCACQPL